MLGQMGEEFFLLSYLQHNPNNLKRKRHLKPLKEKFLSIHNRASFIKETS